MTSNYYMNIFWSSVGCYQFTLYSSVSKQSWLKKSFRPHYTLCLKSQLFDQPLCYSLMMDGCIHNNWSLPSSTLICWILAEMVTLAEFGDLASAIPIRDIWKQKHHKAIRDMWIPSPLVIAKSNNIPKMKEQNPLLSSVSRPWHHPDLPHRTMLHPI
ncbi:hypothetical protein CMV_025816 [Castanea mollissima]|uniref:Uncharacterized protein n=1 Tax=Castanea mollissima TaxID=60419 RepID=A0A8J4VGA7_9ROSI|nr:hypothetical protein CMV_025816 [Castanea mollissima]